MPAPAAGWVERPEPQPDPPARLFCLPYAGGTAQAFRSWAAPIAPVAELCAIALPGRGARTREAPVERMDELTAAVAEAVRPLLGTPFALFGHSMGALLAYELARELRRSGDPEPLRLFVSGLRAPHLPARDDPLHVLPDDELAARLRGFGGTPPQVLESRELMDLFLPAVRADLTACETYAHEEEPPLAVPITAFGGRSDRLASEADLREWARHTTGAFALRMFDGGHFYLSDYESELLEALSWPLEHELVG